ncbi:hypothetical protein [Pseudomonas syringae group sp. J254-4]|uniref:hypothetical protein n=1 Tax=Pseudomonas syringae group sp. J254-4 TaxID=3079589 RepID=UPI003977D94E
MEPLDCQLLTAQCLIGYLSQPALAYGLNRCPLGLAKRANLLVLIKVSVDHLLDADGFAVYAFDRTRCGQLRFTFLDPGLGNLLTVEGLSFLINCRADPIDPNLSREASSLSLRFRAVIVPISFATFQERFATS